MVIRGWLGGVVAAFALYANAAPLDVLLTATPERLAPGGFLDLGAQRMNGALDVFKVRENDPLTAGTKAGDYHDVYISGGYPMTEALWLFGRWGRSTLSSTSDNYRYTNWSVAGQYRWTEAMGAWPTVATRLSAWGNYADFTESTTAVVVPGARLNTVKITEPADQQVQIDVIGSWSVTPVSTVSAFLSLGRSQLSYGALSATTTRNGCDYNVTFTGNDIYGVLAPPCAVVGGVIEQFYDSSGDYGVDVASEIAWRGTFAQAGVNRSWQHGPWTWQAGYMVHWVQRDGVDRILKARGKTPYKLNQNATFQATYRFQPHVSVFARGQLTSNLFFNDIPVTYNSSTSERFKSRYSLFTLGLRAEF